MRFTVGIALDLTFNSECDGNNRHHPSLVMTCYSPQQSSKYDDRILKQWGLAIMEVESSRRWTMSLDAGQTVERSWTGGGQVDYALVIEQDGSKQIIWTKCAPVAKKE